MSKQRFNVFLTLIIVLLIIAGIFAWLTADDINSGAKPVETESTDISPTAAVTTSEPEKTAAPTKAPKESSDPEESEAPEESDDPGIPKTRTLNLSGDIDSTTGTNLNISVKWNAISKNDKTVTLTATVYMYSYTMHYGPTSGSMSINGVNENFTSSRIDYDNSDRLQELKLYTMSVDLPIAVGETVSIPVAATWNFDGVYNSTEFSGISVSDYILIEG